MLSLSLQTLLLVGRIEVQFMGADFPLRDSYVKGISGLK